MDLVKQTRGMVFNIQRFSLHDGPGIRMTVFLKGCSLACRWCHNPESISPCTELQFVPDKCLHCGACEVCAKKAHSISQDPVKHLFDRQKCVGCGDCANNCVTGALSLVGKMYTPAEILKIAEEERGFFGKDGGVTFSGGEAMLQIDFLEETMALCAASGFHTAVDTAGNVPFSFYERLLPYQPLFLYDLKHWDGDLHKQGTGVSNIAILDNFQKLLQKGANLWVRIPVIPGFNDTDADIAHIGQLIIKSQEKAGNAVEKVELLPFHNIGMAKYAGLGKRCELEHIPSMHKCMLEEKLQLLRAMGLPAC